MKSEETKIILKIARKAVENWVRKKIKIKPPAKCPERLKEKKGVFVTLYKKVMGKEELRGCIGLPYPTKPLIEAIIEAAISACEDPRFTPVREDELRDLIIEVSILTTPKRIEFSSTRELLEKIRPFKDGLIIKKGLNSGLFLPQVWEELPTKEEFLSHLCMKAGLPPGCWLEPGIEVYRFEVEAVKENVGRN